MRLSGPAGDGTLLGSDSALIGGPVPHGAAAAAAGGASGAGAVKHAVKRPRAGTALNPRAKGRYAQHLYEVRHVSCPSNMSTAMGTPMTALLHQFAWNCAQTLEFVMFRRHAGRGAKIGDDSDE